MAIHTTYDDWLNLQLVARNLNYIVDDAGFSPTRTANGGLLAGWLDTPLEEKDRVSKLACDIAGKTTPAPYPLFGGAGAFGFQANTNLADAIVAAVPGAITLGHSRVERIRNLRVLMCNLPAYAWLKERGEKFRDIERAIFGSHVPAPYRGEVGEFKLLGAIAQPLGSYVTTTSLGVEIEFPTPAQISKAKEHAEELRSFLRKYSGLYLTKRVNVLGFGGLDEIAKGLDDLGQTYRKRKEPETALRQHLLDEIAKAMHAAFGENSTGLLERVLALVDYEPGDANIRAALRELGLSNAQPAKQERPRAAPVSGFALDAAWNSGKPGAKKSDIQED